MDFGRFSLDVKHVLKEASQLSSKNGRAYKYDPVILFARIWFLQAGIFVHRSSIPITTSVDDFIKGLHEGSTFLQKSFSPHLEEKREYQILKLVEQLPGQVESLYQSSQSEGLVENRVRDLLYKFLVQVMLYQAEVLLLELLKNKISLMLPLKNQIGILREGLIFLTKSDINKQEMVSEEEKLILADMERLAAEVIFLGNSVPADRVTDGAVKSMKFQLSDLLLKVQLLKTKHKELYFQIPRINFPRTPGLGFIKLLLQNLKQQLSREVACGKHEIEAIHDDLEFIISKFGHILDQGIDQKCNAVRTQLVDAAYQVEYVIDTMVLQNDLLSQQLMWLYQLSEEIKRVKKELIDYYENKISDVGWQTELYRYQPGISELTTGSIDEFMVGFNHEKEDIITRLIRGERQREVFSITGMPGIGKTTLAKNVFYSPSIVHHFRTRVWCCVSQTYRKRELLLGILNQISEFRDSILVMVDEDLCVLLHECLRGIRYLIVMDDVWSTAAWDDLQSILPDNSCGSRILMTSRIYNVVPNPYPLQGLSDGESWELLKIKIFGKEGYPSELSEVGQQIARGCKGLPLAIVAVAGLLSRTDKNRWEEIAISVSSRILNDQLTHYMNVFELSYQHLPDHLKQCFLYFGVCPKDEDISVQRLLWLWIAEGFVHNVKSKSLEDLAEEYLMDLIERSLVIAAKTRSNGKVKTCRVDDQVLDFCLLKAKDAKFLQLISSKPSDFINTEQYRLSISEDPEQFIASRPYGPCVRSLLFFPTTEMYAGCPYDVSFISDSFKLLKVLDLKSINVGNSLENGIDSLVHLRYLAVGGDMDSIPSSLSKLQNLETLVVKGLMNKFVLPDTIWSMTKLRNVHVTNHSIFTLQTDKNGSYSKLDNLVALSMPSFPYGEEMNDMILRFPNLRKLKCVLLEQRGGSMNVSWRFPELGSLYLLESLKLSYSGRALKRVEWNLPSSLKELTLSHFRLPWNHISRIGTLPNLEVLKLVSKAFEGSRWEMIEGEFLKLKYLKLDSLNIVHWDAFSDNLPCLEHLVLRNCTQLKEVPFDFAYIDTLEKIEVYRCGFAEDESVRRIIEERLDFGHEILFNNLHSLS